MTIKELILALEDILDKDLPVVCEDGADPSDLNEITKVRCSTLDRYRRTAFDKDGHITHNYVELK